MADDNSLWHFRDARVQNLTIKVLGHDSATSFVATLRPVDYDHWSVKSGDLPEESLVVRTDLHPPIVIPETSVELPKIKFAVEKFSDQSGAGRRKSKRINVALNVLVVLDKESCVGITHDISLGGIKIRGSVPSHFKNKICKIFISSSERGIDVNFTAKVLDTSQSGTRFVFEKMPEAEHNALKLWLKDVERNLKKLAS